MGYHLGEARILILLISLLHLKQKLRGLCSIVKLSALFGPFFVSGLLSSGKRLLRWKLTDRQPSVRQTMKLSANQTLGNGGRDGEAEAFPACCHGSGVSGQDRPGAAPAMGLSHRPARGCGGTATSGKNC